MERLWCCFRRCRRPDRSSGRLLYSSGLLLFSMEKSALCRFVGETRPYLVGWEDSSARLRKKERSLIVESEAGKIFRLR